MREQDIFKGIKACIFDLDGTLVDSMKVWAKVDRQFFLSKGMTIPEDYQKAIAHMTLKENARYTVERFGFSETPEELIAIWMGFAKAEYAFNIKAKSHAKELLSLLKQKGYRIALATSNSSDLYLPCLENNGLLPYFDFLQNAEALNTNKKEPKIYLALSEKMGAEAKETLVFEDILTAIKTAHNAGFRTVCVKDESSRKDLPIIETLADLVIEDFQSLVDVV